MTVLQFIDMDELLRQLVEVLAAIGDHALSVAINRLLLKWVPYQTLCATWGMML